MKNHGSGSIRSAECFFRYSTVVIYGYYATYLIARARNNSTTSGLYDKNEHRSIAIGRCYILLCGSGRFYWLLGTRC